MTESDSRHDETRDLLDRALAGDEQALELLYRSHRRPLLQFLKSRMSGPLQSRHSASDLHASIWCEVLRVLDEFDDQARGMDAFRGFLFTTARRILIDYERAIRRHRRDVNQEAEASDEVVQRLRGSVTSPSGAAIRGENQEWLERGMAQLSDGDRQVVEWARLRGYSNAEIAERLGISEGAARNRHNRALARLGKILERMKSDPGESR